MTTSQIIWIVVIAVAALVLIGLIVGLMRKKSLADKHEKAELLRERADVEAAGLPDAQARADQAATEAERARLEAQRAEERAAAVRAEAAQERAIHEEKIRAADRLDPDVDHEAKDYSPDVVDPAGPSDVPADPAYADPDTGRASGSPSGSANAPPPAPAPSSDADGSTATLEPTDTTPRDETVGNDRLSMRDRLEGDTPEESDDHPDEAGGTHRT
jgi:hypothetical protein